MQSPKFFAAEGTDYDDEGKKQKRRRVIDLLDGSDPTYQRKLAVYQASDNPCPDTSGCHGLEGVGFRYSYFKMENIDLEGLRQCFIDSDVRIRQIDEVPSFAFPRIKGVRIDSGFLDGQEMQFHHGLTSILGGKGAGKSLLIEFMRFVFNQEPSNPSIAADHLSKLRSRLCEYGSVEVTYVDENGNESVINRTFRELEDSPYEATIDCLGSFAVIQSFNAPSCRRPGRPSRSPAFPRSRRAPVPAARQDRSGCRWHLQGGDRNSDRDGISRS